jgi:glycosyltransferase involved in cell wall biosynthesis
MTVSVIIPARNAVRTIHLAIASALNAGCNDVIVIDDSSEDGTYDAAITAAYQSPGKVRVYWTGGIRAGVVYARNKGILQARCELILPLDADDTLLPESIETYLSHYKPGTLVYSGWLEGDKDICAPPPGMLPRKNVAHATWLFERSAWRAVNGYNPDYNLGAEDYHFMVALVNHGITPICIDAALYRRSINVGTRTDAAKGLKNCWYNMLKAEFPEFMQWGSLYAETKT